MALDPRIILGYQAPRIQSPMEGQQQMLSLASLLQQQQMGEMQMADAKRQQAEQQRLADLIRGHTGDDESLGQKIIGAGFLDKGLAVKKGALEAKQAQAKIDNERSQARERALNVYRRQVGTVQGPEAAAALVRAAYEDPELGPVMQRVPLDQALAGIPTDPQKLRQWALGESEGAAKVLELGKPTTYTASSGKTDTVYGYSALDTTPRALTTTQKVMTPGEEATDRRAAATLTEQKRHNTAMEGFRSTEVGRAPAGTYDPERGVLVNTRDATATPVKTADGNPLAAKVPESTKKELASIDAQTAVIDSAIKDVQANPGAFGLTRGLATMAGAVPESLAGRLDSAAERDTRAYVYNVVSKVINERAGAAQSKQELARLRAFLPAETDNAEQVTDKLNSFRGYLADLKAGYQPGKEEPKTMPSPNGPRIPRVATEADYAKLPKGATYLDPNGVQRTKK